MKKRYKRRTEAALKAYGVAAKSNAPDETRLVDFLADMLHRYEADPSALTDPSYGGDPDPVAWLRSCVASAVNHYSAESGWPNLPEAQERVTSRAD